MDELFGLTRFRLSRKTVRKEKKDQPLLKDAQGFFPIPDGRPSIHQMRMEGGMGSGVKLAGGLFLAVKVIRLISVPGIIFILKRTLTGRPFGKSVL